MKPGDLVRHHKNHAWIGVVMAVNVPTRLYEGVYSADADDNNQKVEIAWIGHGIGKIHPRLVVVLNESR